MNFDEYTALKQKYYAANPYEGDASRYVTPQDLVSGGADNYSQNLSQDQWNDKTNADWYGGLTPAQKEEYNRLGKERDAAAQKKRQMSFLAAAGAMAAPGILGAMGGGAPASAAAGGDLGMAGWMGSGAGPMGVEAGAAGLAGGTGGASGAMSGLGNGLDFFTNGGSIGDMFGNGLGGLGGDFAGLDGFGGMGDIGAGLGGIGGAPGSSASGSSWWDSIKDIISGKPPGGGLPGGTTPGGTSPPGGGFNWGNLLGNTAGIGAGLAAIQALRNREPMPGVPDFMKLAEQTAASRNQQVDAQTMANRANQTNAMGDTLNWTKDPSGQWNQSVKFGEANQQKFDQQNAMMSALRGQIQNQQQNPAQLPAMQGFDPSQLQRVNPGAMGRNLPAMGALSPRWGG